MLLNISGDLYLASKLRIKAALSSVMFALAVLSLSSINAQGQSNASIQGQVLDQNGQAISGIKITIHTDALGFDRTTATDAEGRYFVAALPLGDYQLEASGQGFQTLLRRVILSVGNHPTIDLVMQAGLPEQRVEVSADGFVETTNYEIGGVINRRQIQELPLNGRNFLELAQLEPGVNVTSVANPGIIGNSYQRVNVAGGFPSQTRIFADGSTVTDRFVGGTMINFSQESVREFRVSTFNADPTLGLTGAGAINVQTRQGANDINGSAFIFYRDHNLAAYPALTRDPRTPDPFFARRQIGITVGGPFRRDRFFWFFNYEHRDQDAVFSITNNHPVFSKLDVIYPTPLQADPFDVRLDAQFTAKHRASLRYSSDYNRTVAPGVTVGMPSNWQSLRNRGFQIQAALTSALSSRTANDLRISYGYLTNHLNPISAGQCRDPVSCIGAGAPNILVFDAPQFRIGTQANTPLNRWQRNYEMVDNVSWLQGSHQLGFGGQWEHLYFKAFIGFNDPAQITLWGPTNLQTPALKPLFDALPASLKSSGGPPPTLAEILQLPLRSFTTGIGDPGYPGPFNFDQASRNDRFRFYFQDTWRATNRLTFKYGISYSLETNLFDHDLTYPAYLIPLIGADLRPPQRDKNNFDPSVGAAWTLGKRQRTVLRSGFGVYRDENALYWKARDRAFIGPSGNGRVIVDGAVTGLSFTSTPTAFRGADLLPLLPGIRSNLSALFGDGTNPAVRGVEVIKQGDQILAPDVTTSYSIQASVGIQTELRPNLVLTADYVLRQYYQVGPLQNTYIIDRNRFNRPRVTGVNPDTGVVSFVRDPVIPLCTAAQSVALNPKDQCSTGPINVFSSGARYRYQGLHMTLERRWSDGLQFLAGYAYSQDIGFFEFLSYDDPLAGSGNNPSHRRHKLTISGVWSPVVYKAGSHFRHVLQNGWTIAFISQTFSPTPLNAILTGLDLDGDGISRTLLPGAVYQGLGEGMTAQQLRSLVASYNVDVEARTRRIQNPDGTTTVVRPRTPFNQIINSIVLPDQFSNGDSFITQDVRLTRTIKLGEKFRLNLMGEVFNLFNVSNLTGYSDVLNQPNYGQPSSRVGQAFGTGGPRAFQFGARLEF